MTLLWPAGPHLQLALQCDDLQDFFRVEINLNLVGLEPTATGIMSQVHLPLSHEPPHCLISKTHSAQVMFHPTSAYIIGEAIEENQVSYIFCAEHQKEGVL